LVFLCIKLRAGEGKAAIIIGNTLLKFGIFRQKRHQVSCKQRVQITFEVVKQIGFKIVSVDRHCSLDYRFDTSYIVFQEHPAPEDINFDLRLRETSNIGNFIVRIPFIVAEHDNTPLVG